MTIKRNPLAGKPVSDALLLNVPALLAAYSDLQPDPSVQSHRVGFGTSGHRGSSLDRSFNEWHVLAITQAICDYRKMQNIDGPLFLGIDTHALSQPAFETALEVLAANGVVTFIAASDEYTPTPAVSHAILCHNRNRKRGIGDGIVLTPSHNPPESGGYKYNSPNGGPADTAVTKWIEQRANHLIEKGLGDVKRVPFALARRANTTCEHNYLGNYVTDLVHVLDFDIIRESKIRMGVDPLGGAGVHYWARIAEHYKLDLTIVSDVVDPTFSFMSLDWDGRIRMDPSSAYAMQRLIAMKDKFDISFACDTDHDRHGIVAPSIGLMPSNHFLAVAIDYLFRHRPLWSPDKAIGKTVVSSAIIDRVAERLERKLYEVPVGFKWYVDGLFDGSLGFAGEESAGAAFSRIDGSVWTTDKDGITAALLSAEMTARSGRDPGELYHALNLELGGTVSDRQDAHASVEQKARLSKLSPRQIHSTLLAGDKIEDVIDHAPGNNAAIGGIKVMSEHGWFAARPSGTEDIYKIYAESFRDEIHLRRIFQDAQNIVDSALSIE